jgi:hypothetical protein
MERIRVRQEYCINLVNMLPQGIYNIHRKVLIPATVQQKPKLINLEKIAKGRFFLDPREGG